MPDRMQRRIAYASHSFPTACGMPEILVLYYSRGGSVARLARQIARGIGEVDGMQARLRTVPPVAAVTSTAAPPAKRAPRKSLSKVALTETISDEQRYRMIAEAAYYRAESNQFQSDPVRDWIEAEKDIATLLNGPR